MIKIFIGLLVLLVASGQLPSFIKEVHISRLKLIKASQASKWPRAIQLEVLIPKNK